MVRIPNVIMYSEKLKNLILLVLVNEDYKDEGIKKLNKILYFVDFYYYKDNEKLISGSEYAKAPMGPILNDYKLIFNSLVEDGVLVQEKECPTIYKPKIAHNLSAFKAEEIEHIDKVLKRYGKLSSSELEAISHVQQPWLLTENGDIIDPDLALLIADDDEQEIEIHDEKLKAELEDLARDI